MQALVACDSLQFSETKAGADLRLRLLELSSLASPRHRLPRRSYSPILLNEFRSIVKIQAPTLVSAEPPIAKSPQTKNVTTTDIQNRFVAPTLLSEETHTPKPPKTKNSRTAHSSMRLSSALPDSENGRWHVDGATAKTQQAGGSSSQ